MPAANRLFSGALAQRGTAMVKRNATSAQRRNATVGERSKRCSTRYGRGGTAIRTENREPRTGNREPLKRLPRDPLAQQRVDNAISIVFARDHIVAHERRERRLHRRRPTEP